MAVTPIVAPNRDRTFRKCMAILFDNLSTRTGTMKVGGATIENYKRKAWQAAG